MIVKTTRRKLLSKFTLTAFLCFGLVACGQPEDKVDYNQQGEVAQGDMYVSASLGEASNLVPFLSGESASHQVSGYIYNSLLKYDKDLNLTSDLAKSWDISDDGLSIIFHLRDDIVWEDGEKLTAHDVMATYKAITDPNTRTPYAGDYQMVKEAKVVDDYTFKVSYEKTFAPALGSWAGLSILPKHILDKTDDINETELVTKPLGTGTYLLEKWDRGSDVLLTANDNYYDGRANINKVRIRVIPDQDTQFLELRSGRLDSMSLKPNQYLRIQKTDDLNSLYNTYKYLSNTYVYMGFKLDHPLFKDKKVRQALSYATPRKSLIKGILRGFGQPAIGPFKPGTWAASETLKPYPYDIEKAKKLLAEAGWKKTNSDGILVKDGKPFSFTVMTNQGNDQRIKTAEIMQHAFKQIGVDMNIRIQEWSTFIENTINNRDFEAYILGWSLSPEPDPFDIWHSSKTGPREFNVVGFNNPTADKIIEEARHTFDQQERKELYQQFQEILHDEQPYLFLYVPEALVAVHKRFKGIEPAPAGIGHNFEDWYVPANQQRY